jgi:hypothetical protein
MRCVLSYGMVFWAGGLGYNDDGRRDLLRRFCYATALCFATPL